MRMAGSYHFRPPCRHTIRLTHNSRRRRHHGPLHRRPARRHSPGQAGIARGAAPLSRGVRRGRGGHARGGARDRRGARARRGGDPGDRMRGDRRRAGERGAARAREVARGLRDPRRVRARARRALGSRDRRLRGAQSTRRTPRTSRRGQVLRPAGFQQAADPWRVLVGAAGGGAPVAGADAGARVPEPAVARAQRGAPPFRSAPGAGLCRPAAPPPAGLGFAGAVGALRRRLGGALDRGQLPPRLSPRVRRQLARLRSLRRGLAHRGGGDRLAGGLLDVPHLPGLDRADAARPRRRHAATGADRQRDGLCAAARTAGRRRRRRPVRRDAGPRAVDLAPSITRRCSRRSRRSR